MKPWAERFYNSDAWRVCRDAFLQSKGWLCERCSTPHDPVPAKIAHHKRYLTEKNINDPYVALSWDNLEALCQQCHNEEHHKSNKKVYSFDANGNIIPSPPIHSKNLEGRTPSGGG
ncbi:HNH endonuclease [Dehalobacter sp. UNSWDHB]|uniref:HNH endonuclease n=1 Tax=Dehalobacter sp. UNSWDHB TaxID=1339256 RepID=UPI000692362F|nr:HNH endonuclease [Dehalobacter sp. UNSWDHB]